MGHLNQFPCLLRVRLFSQVHSEAESTRRIEKILIANRGEIACRIIRTGKRLEIRTVAVFSDADRDSLHVKSADEAVHIGQPAARLSYLNAASIVKSAFQTGAQIISMHVSDQVAKDLTRMKQSKDPFEAAFEEQESPPDSPLVPNDLETQTNAVAGDALDLLDGDDDPKVATHSAIPSTSTTSRFVSSTYIVSVAPKTKEDDEEEEEENVEVELAKFPSSGDPDKMAKMQAILSQFTEEQMSRYESFRRAGFQKANMKRLLANISGTQKISVPMTIVVSGIAKMFVGELVETARIVMTERKDSGPIRPCHLREAYRRLKIEGKVPKKSVPRLFR